MSKEKTEADFACILCDFACNDSEAFQVHQGEHKAERPFKCSHCECAYTTRSKDALRMHMYSQHKAKKKYQCGFCPHRTVNKSQMERHIVIHTNEKPYKCDECDFRTNEKRSLAVHKRIHLKIRPLRCNLCDQHFRNTSNLQDHVRVHTGERPYKCTMCDYESAQSSNLLRHQRTQKCLLTCSIKSPSQISSKEGFCSGVNRIERSERKFYSKETEKRESSKKHRIQDTDPSNRSKTDTEIARALSQRVEVPILLPGKVLENWTVGQDPYTTRDVNVETESAPLIHKSVKSIIREEIVIVASEEDRQDPSSSKFSKASGPLSNSNAYRDQLECVDEYSLQLPQTIDGYLKASVNNTHGRPRPYTCAECTFTCFRRERLERHYRRNHSDARAFKTKAEYVHKSEQVSLVDKIRVRVSSSMKLKAYHELSSAGNRMSVSVVPTETSTAEGIESESVARVFPSPSTLVKCTVVKPCVALKVPEKDTCDYCDKRFSSAYALLDHLRHHSGQTLFKCKAPGCIFKTMNKLWFNIHERDHP